MPYQEYPKTLYSAAGERTVASRDEEKAARSCGWHLSPLSLAAAQKKALETK